MADILHIDYETRSAYDLRAGGLDNYAKHPSTEILCMGYAFNNEPPDVWIPSVPLPDRIFDHMLEGGEIWAHNAAFEIAITNHVGDRFAYTMPVVRPEQFVCTMAMAHYMSLPGALERLAPALGLDTQKDMAGQRLMVQMSKPREINEVTGEITWWEDPEKLEKLYAYCKQDIVVERAAGERMLRLSPRETKIWLLDQKINSLGVKADVKAIRAAIDLVEKEKDRLDLEMRVITEGHVATCTAVAQIKNHLEYYGILSPTLDKEDVVKLLQSNSLHPTARRILELRREAARAATSKFAPMLTGAGTGDRVRGTYVFSGANTHRWSSYRIQLHNLKRQSLKSGLISQIIQSIRNGMDARTIEDFYGDSVMELLSQCVRGFLISETGFDLLSNDFNAIEARVIAWLAGQENILDVFRSNAPIYKSEAAGIFNKSIADIREDERQVGKVAILSLGFQGGVGALQNMAKNYRVKLAPALPYLLSIASPEQREAVIERYRTQGSKYEISEEEFLASDLIKLFWRAKNQNIVKYWGDVENAAISAFLNPGVPFTAGPHPRHVTYKKVGSFLFCLLPSGSVLSYPYPELRRKVTPWGREKEMLTYMSEDVQSKKWQRYSTYGGSLVENCTQSVARDIQAEAMLNLDNAGYNIILHTHDEIVCEEAEHSNRLTEMTRIMAIPPAWAPDLPIAVAGWMDKRYRK